MKKPIPYKEPEPKKPFFQNKKFQKAALLCLFTLINVLVAVIVTVILSIIFSANTWVIAIIVAIILSTTSVLLGKKFLA